MKYLIFLIVFCSACSSGHRTTTSQSIRDPKRVKDSDEIAQLLDQPNEQNRFSGKEIKANFEGVPLTEAFFKIFQGTDYNLIMTKEVNGTANIRLGTVPWDYAFAVLAKANKLSYWMHGPDTIVISDFAGAKCYRPYNLGKMDKETYERARQDLAKFCGGFSHSYNYIPYLNPKDNSAEE